MVDCRADSPAKLGRCGLIALMDVQDKVRYLEDIEDVKGVELIDPTQHSVAEFAPAFSYALSLLAPSTDRAGD